MDHYWHAVSLTHTHIYIHTTGAMRCKPMAFPSAAAVSDKPVDNNCQPHATKRVAMRAIARRLITPRVPLFVCVAPRCKQRDQICSQTEPTHGSSRFSSETTKNAEAHPRPPRRRAMRDDKICVKPWFIFLY